MSILQSLSDIITSNLKVIDDTYTFNNTKVPTLDDLVAPTALDKDPTIVGAKQLVVAAAAQLIATLRAPPETVMLQAAGMYSTVCLRTLVDASIPDIIMEHGQKGVHVNEISSRSAIDASYISRILRFLATRHIFKEVSPDVFANNRISVLLCKGKSFQEITSDPVGQFDAAPMAAFVSGEGEEVLKSATFLPAFVKDPASSTSAFNMAFETDKKMWDWYHDPGNEWRSRRFTAAMKGASESRVPPQTFTDAILYLKLKANDVVVDVGGNIGTLVAVLKESYPDLQYIVQDLQRQIADAQLFWNAYDPEALASGKVRVQVQDFFNPQPIKGAAVYLLRVVIHDWPDSDAIKILSGLRDAAENDSKVVIFDYVARHTCDDAESDHAAPRPPQPLLANLGEGASAFDTTMDIQMLTLFNGKERTLAEFNDIAQRSGWKVDSVKPGVVSTFILSPV